MKSPLLYQMTEKSAGETSIFNCLTFLFDREEMPLEFLKIMRSFSISCYDEDGLPTNEEFCDNLLFFSASWINDYAKEKNIPLVAKYLNKDEVNLLEIRKCLLVGGCVSLKVSRNGKHFITITKMDDDYIYAFDPFYKPEILRPIKAVEIVNDKPFNYNRKILIENFISEKATEYTLGPENLREAVLFYRNDIIPEREFVD